MKWLERLRSKTDSAEPSPKEQRRFYERMKALSYEELEKLVGELTEGSAASAARKALNQKLLNAPVEEHPKILDEWSHLPEGSPKHNLAQAIKSMTGDSPDRIESITGRIGRRQRK